MERESLPTGIDMPSAGHNSIPTAFTVSNNFASSPSSPQAHIQLADIFIFPISPMNVPAIFVMASPIAILPEAGALMIAIGVLSPMLMASPEKDLKEAAVTAASEIGV